MQKHRRNVKSPLLIDLDRDNTISITLDESSVDNIVLDFENQRHSTDYILIAIIPGRSKTVIFPDHLIDKTVIRKIDFSESSINVVFFHLDLLNYHIDRIIRSTL